MSIAYDIGFKKRLILAELDEFMESLGFEMESPGQRRGNFTRVYQLCNDSVQREITLFYSNNIGIRRNFFGEKGKELQAYGSLTTFSTEPTYTSIEERLRIIEEKNIRTQHEYYKHLSPERLKFYETALAVRDHYDAIVFSEQTNEEIDPDKPFPEKQ